MKTLINLIIFLTIFILTYRCKGTTEAEYWSNFEVVEGKITGPFVVATISNDRRVNDKSWYSFEKDLTVSQKLELDSLFYPIKENSLYTKADTLFDYSKEGWEEKYLGYKKKSISIDTVLGGKMDVVLEQIPVFDVNYYFSVEGTDKYFEISPYDFEEIDYWSSDENTPYEDFVQYKSAVDELIGDAGVLKVTTLKTNKEGWHAPYIIKDGNNKELFYDEEGFEDLKIAKQELGKTGIMYRNPYSGELNENFILWHDNWFFRIVAAVLIIAIIIQSLIILTTPTQKPAEKSLE